MLVNVSYKNEGLYKKIDSEIGKSYALKERIQMGGIGSPKLIITSSSIQIYNLLILDNHQDSCNIELRPKGIIVRFRSLLETFALVIPYYKLALYKSRGQEYSIHIDNYYIKVAAKTKEVHDFMKRIVKNKTDASPIVVDDL